MHRSFASFAHLACITALMASAVDCSPAIEASDGAESVEQALASCVGGARPSTGVALERVWPSVSFDKPVAMVEAPGRGFYVVEKTGLVKLMTSAASPSTFVDLRSRVNASPNEAGLLGMALHPKFAQNGLVFFSYTKPSSTSPANLRSVIARAKSTDGGATIDLTTLTELLSFDQPYSNHNGGHIAFGKDENLYAGFGDGGSGGDPQGHGQNVNTLLGAILRLDVDATTYAIPPTNPFASGGGRPEIYAWGFRNPWRFSFDRVTGDLWAGDVGQSAWEEVDKVVLGGNYGWRTREGNHCYGASTCSSAGLIAPVVEYPRSDGISITGGFVYRGTAISTLVGRYVYGDFGSGRIWSIDASAPSPSPRLLMESGKSIASFAEDASGELYVLDYGTGQVHRVVATVASNGIPSRLSQTGCFLASDPSSPAPSLVPYAVNAELWSDGADKARWMALPSGGKIRVGADGDWELPVGTVLAKSFSLAGKKIETRLFVRHTDGGWAGYAYEWNDAQTDALLLETGKTKLVGAQSWTIPSRADCMTCHNGAAGGSLGLETQQLNRTFTYPDGTTQNQLDRLQAMGAFSAIAPLPAVRTALPRPHEPGANAPRARAYLHANCSFCHRPDGPGRGALDLRFSADLAGTHACNAAPELDTLGVVNARLFAPGQPSRSMLSVRMKATGAGRMPPLASARVDAAGAALIDQWIGATTSCF
ncbi:MAG: PQQ-dependent sugar dehydrogenase [Labilithrix sp.]|nr:PQQ-dependent sugar dehydrogenase [Labilithrix sp.]